MTDDRRVDASADKSLFLETLTRDIALVPAISDLIDNSVDGALRETDDGTSEQGRRLQDFNVLIDFDVDSFSIHDNCGGIDADRARNYAFRFGRSAKVASVAGGTGQFGVGMKRALFKIGRMFKVESVARTSSFSLTVDIDEWVKSDDWTFTFDEVAEGEDNRTGNLGTAITITRLNSEVAREFSHSRFVGTLRTTIAMNHQRPLTEGLSIKVNNKTVEPYRPRLAASDSIAPLSRETTVGGPFGDVTIRTVAGVAKEDVGDEPEPEKRTYAERAGWYVYCNRRLVLPADKTFLTGWGDSAANYHPQYRAFRGFCYLSAENPAALPWNTTKTGVDHSHNVFRSARKEMSTALKEVQSALNVMKKERRSVSEPKERRLERAVSEASAVSPEATPRSTKFEYPDPTPPARPVANVLYKVDRDRMEAAQDHLDGASAAEVGRHSFDYWYDSEVEN